MLEIKIICGIELLITDMSNKFKKFGHDQQSGKS
jgi:hypothetical protein